MPEPFQARRRVRRTEMMDRPGLPAGERDLALAGLERIAAWPGQRRPILDALRRLLGRPAGRPLRLVEVGAGGGSLARWLEPRLLALGYKAEVLATDREAAPGVRSLDAVSGSLPDADVYFSNLVLHHLADDDVRRMLANQSRAGRLGWVHFDLHRHWLHYYAAAALLRLGGFPAINRIDACWSIQQGFSRAELAALAPPASPGARLRWTVPFRWELSWARR